MTARTISGSTSKRGAEDPKQDFGVSLVEDFYDLLAVLGSLGGTRRTSSTETGSERSRFATCSATTRQSLDEHA